MSGRNRYSPIDKAVYVRLCWQYNKAMRDAFRTEDGRAEFVRASVKLHGQAGRVPIKWRTQGFVRRQGTGPL